MKTTNNLDRLLAILAAACVGLSACGGGDSNGGVVSPAPPLSVTLFAGALQSAGSNDGRGAKAQFNRPADVAQDSAGNVYVADAGNHTIRRIAVDGTVSTLAGSAAQAGSADGTGANARFSGPMGIAVDAAGNVYVSDTGNSTLRRIGAGGVVTTISGVAGQAGSTDGNTATARFRAPLSLAVDPSGSLYVVDDNAVRKRSPDGTVSTFAGKAGDRGSRASGSAAQARFFNLSSVALDGAGNVYVAEAGFSNLSGGSVRKFDSQGQALPYGRSADGVRATPYPADIASDAAGNVYVVSNGFDQPSPNFLTFYRNVDRITPDGLTTTSVAGGTTDLRTVEGPGASARFTDPRAIAVGPDGRIVVAETSSSAIRLINLQTDLVSTLAGGNGGGEVDGAAASARFNEPQGLATGPEGTLYVADGRNRSVRAINTAGTVSTLARGFSRFAYNVATGPNDGTVYALYDMAPTFGRGISAIARSGIATGFGAIGPNSTVALAADAAGNVYACENGDVVVLAPGGGKRILATGILAQHLALDAAGNVYFTSNNFTVGVVDPAGRVVVRAGRPDQPGDADGAGAQAQFRAPNALALDPAGNIYVGDGIRIRKVAPDGTVTSIADITLVQGAQSGFAATSLKGVNGLAWSAGALYATVLNGVIRITP